MYKYWLQQCETAKDEKNKQQKIVDQLTKDLREKKKDCADRQGEFESISCSRLETTKMTNRDYPACYDVVLKTWRQSVLGFRKNEIMRFTTWRALQRIKCLLKVIDGKGDILKGINECRQKTYTTDFYNLIWWNPPIKKKQYPVKAYACNNEFRLFYKDYDHKNTPMAKCQWCDGYRPTPRPTPEPTPEPTPLPTVMPTPKPTQFPHCEAEMFEHDNFEGRRAKFLLGTFEHDSMLGHQFKNDDASSMKLTGNTDRCRVTLYQHGDMTGRKGTFTEGSYTLKQLQKNNVYNDDVSSLKVWLASAR
jgi:hypothetical protein